MLQALVAFAERNNLLDDLDFEERRVDVGIRIDERGRFVGAMLLGEDGKDKRMRAPRVPEPRNSGGRPAFIVDNLQYVLGWAKPGKSRGFAEKCWKPYKEMIAEAARQTGDAGLLALERFLNDEEACRAATEALWNVFSKQIARARDRTKAEKKLRESAPGKVAVFYVGDETKALHERPAAESWWRARNQPSGASPSEARVCLVTGKLEPLARTHPKIQGIPGGAGPGANLVSFDKDPFCSHGFDQGQNAPVSERAAQAYVRAIEHMLEKVGDSGRRRQAIVLPPGDTAILFWTRDDNDTPKALLDLFAPEAETHADQIHAVQAPWRGLPPAPTDDTRFYAVALSANSARVVVRDWIETTAADVKRNIRRYFEDLEIGERDGQPMPISRLLHSLQAAPDAADPRGLPSALAARLFSAALLGSAFPLEILAAALRRLRLPPSGNDRDALRARVALIKATLIRRHRHDAQPLEVTVSLDENNPSVPYLLGRLFAVLEKLQSVAIGDPNATIRDRWFGAASSTPGLVFPRLLRLSVHHASKAADEGGGWLEKLKGEILARLPATPLPPTLTLEEQGLFAIGYYHQRERFFQKRADTHGESEEA